LPQNIRACVSRKYPEWIVLISTKDRNGRQNIMPAGWSMFTSHEPLLFAVSVGVGRYTHDVIHETGEFVIAYPKEGMGPDIVHTGTHSGPDKLKDTSFEFDAAELVRPGLIKGALVNLECRLHSAHLTGDHTIFVGEVVKGHYSGEPGRRLMNFGAKTYAVAQMESGTIFRYE
jgi:flavin reductase (DIM6/NTAB) family NADH-FMN oxidoreductase RutF